MANGATGAAQDGNKKVAKYDQKSGLVSVGSEWIAAHGGMPPKKDVSQVDEVNMPDTYSGSVLRSKPGNGSL